MSGSVVPRAFQNLLDRNYAALDVENIDREKFRRRRSIASVARVTSGKTVLRKNTLLYFFPERSSHVPAKKLSPGNPVTSFAR